MGKSHLFLTCLLAMSCLFVQAQPQVGSFSITPKVGFNMSTLWGDDTPIHGDYIGNDFFTLSDIYCKTHNAKAKMTPGFSLGVDLQKQFAPRVGFSVGAYYTQQGLKFDVPGDDVFQCHKLKTDLYYIQVPMQLKFYVAKGLALQTGAQLEFLTKTESISQYTINGIQLKNGEAKRELIIANGYDFFYYPAYVDYTQDPTLDFCAAVPVGLSYEYNNWVAELRCDLPLTRVYNYESYDSKVKQFNFSCLFTLGYRFELSKSAEK